MMITKDGIRGIDRTARPPVVLVPASNQRHQSRNLAIAGMNYVDALRLAGCMPLVVPTGRPEEIGPYLALADGVLLTGAIANVHPGRFGEEVLDPSLPLDSERDGLTMPLITRALAEAVPLFGICRGFQEMNVALGGSLHQAVHDLIGMDDHRSRCPETEPLHYAPAHGIVAVQGGLLERIAGRREATVNSCHGQGVNRLAPGLRAEAHAPDGLIEAFTMPGAAGFNFAVQWHPEWRALENLLSKRLFLAFGEACRDYRDGRSPTL